LCIVQCCCSAIVIVVAFVLLFWCLLTCVLLFVIICSWWCCCCCWVHLLFCCCYYRFYFCSTLFIYFILIFIIVVILHCIVVLLTVFVDLMNYVLMIVFYKPCWLWLLFDDCDSDVVPLFLLLLFVHCYWFIVVVDILLFFITFLLHVDVMTLLLMMTLVFICYILLDTSGITLTSVDCYDTIVLYACACVITCVPTHCTWPDALCICCVDLLLLCMLLIHSVIHSHWYHCCSVVVVILPCYCWYCCCYCHHCCYCDVCWHSFPGHSCWKLEYICWWCVLLSFIPVVPVHFVTIHFCNCWRCSVLLIVCSVVVVVILPLMHSCCYYLPFYNCIYIVLPCYSLLMLFIWLSILYPLLWHWLLAHCDCWYCCCVDIVLLIGTFYIVVYCSTFWLFWFVEAFPLLFLIVVVPFCWPDYCSVCCSWYRLLCLFSGWLFPLMSVSLMYTLWLLWWLLPLPLMF